MKRYRYLIFLLLLCLLTIPVSWASPPELPLPAYYSASYGAISSAKITKREVYVKLEGQQGLYEEHITFEASDAKQVFVHIPVSYSDVTFMCDDVVTEASQTALTTMAIYKTENWKRVFNEASSTDSFYKVNIPDGYVESGLAWTFTDGVYNYHLQSDTPWTYVYTNDSSQFETSELVTDEMLVNDFKVIHGVELTALEAKTVLYHSLEANTQLGKGDLMRVYELDTSATQVVIKYQLPLAHYFHQSHEVLGYGHTNKHGAEGEKISYYLTPSSDFPYVVSERVNFANLNGRYEYFELESTDVDLVFSKVADPISPISGPIAPSSLLYVVMFYIVPGVLGLGLIILIVGIIIYYVRRRKAQNKSEQ